MHLTLNSKCTNLLKHKCNKRIMATSIQDSDCEIFLYPERAFMPNNTLIIFQKDA